MFTWILIAFSLSTQLNLKQKVHKIKQQYVSRSNDYMLSCIVYMFLIQWTPIHSPLQLLLFTREPLYKFVSLLWIGLCNVRVLPCPGIRYNKHPSRFFSILSLLCYLGLWWSRRHKQFHWAVRRILFHTISFWKDNTTCEVTEYMATWVLIGIECRNNLICHLAANWCKHEESWKDCPTNV